MGNFLNADTDRYGRVAESHPNQGEPGPSAERRGHSPRPAPMHPAIEGLPPRRTSPGQRDSAESTVGPPVPSAESMARSPYADIYKDVIAIMPRYGRGEDYASLRASFPGITAFLTAMGGICENASTSFVLNTLDEESMDYIRYHIGQRIERERDQYCRVLMQVDLQRITDKALMQPKTELVSSDEKIMESIMKILPRYAKGESMESFKGEVPNIAIYLADNAYSSRNGGQFLWTKFTKKQRMEIDEAVKSRRLCNVRHPISEDMKPKRFMRISTNFSNTKLDLSEVCRLGRVTEDRLSKYVDLKTGNLTVAGEKIISSAHESYQAAIRWNYKARFQRYAAPAGTPSRPAKPDDTFPGASFFAGVSEQWRALGNGAEPATPRPPAPSHDSVFDGLSSLHQGGFRTFDRPTPSEVEQPWRAPTPRTPAPSHDSVFDGLSSLHQGGYRTFDLNTPGEVEQPWRAPTPRPPAPSHDSVFGGLSSLDEGGYRAFDLNTPGEVEQPWRAPTPRTPAPSHDSVFDGLSSLDERGYRAFDLKTPGEVEQPWHAGMPMASPERIVVDALPSPAVTEGTGLRGLTADAFLGDEHLFAYLGALGRHLDGRPHAGLLNFADPQQVNLLVSGDSQQRRSVLRHLAAPDTPPIVFLPINDPDLHWSLLVVDRRTHAAFHYDSMVPPGRAADATRTFQYAAAERAARAMGIDTPVRGMPIAQQRNGYSCGDHVLEGIAVLAHRVVDGTFGDPGGMDLRHIRPDRTRIAEAIAGTGGFQAHGGAPAIPGEQRHRPDDLDDPADDRKKKRSRF